MIRSLSILFCCICFAASSHAQTVFNGRVLEDKTRLSLRSVIVENLSSKLRAITGDDGRFSIAAKVGDLLVFKKFSYAPDTLLLTDMHDREIFLQLQTTMLKDVTIRDSSGRTGIAEKNMTYYDPQYHGQLVVPHLDRNKMEDGGAVFRIHYFTKDDKDKKKAAEKEEVREVNEEIIKTFSADNIGKYVPLKGKDMDNFILLYIPDVKVYNSKDFNLLSYLNDCYQKWLKLSDDERKAGQLFQQ
ncbi:hypothetical protein HDF24_22665 [Mucilaginibacter sp. X4EP1]|uniref:hypothetical protein n=1 Tax=Mucilaginibacter sp. X4EP1 TaxID=2723092 RepID=UPI0021672690|nr:hypothetical protein [Mucilaginibacter sp. X4EP1]MCS3816475.1 hypothetical protein [Mucilaginibacter sp. X4EP1]